MTAMWIDTSFTFSSLSGITQDQDQDRLLVKCRNDNHSPGPIIRPRKKYMYLLLHGKINMVGRSENVFILLKVFIWQ